MMLESWEIRWFFEGAPPPEVRAPFKVHAAERVDSYVAVGEDLGIKRREGKLEVKGRIAHRGVVVLSPRCAGHLERWGKWSHDAPDVKLSPTIDVHKKRAQCNFPLGAAELTQLEIHGRAWWTLGLEMYGDADLLIATATDFVETNALTLHAPASMSYPAWLAMLRA
jgi:hypothetical protein